MKKFVINRTVIWLPDGSRRISDTTLVTDNLEGERQLLKEVYKPDRIDFNYLTIEENDKKKEPFQSKVGIQEILRQVAESCELPETFVQDKTRRFSMVDPKCAFYFCSFSFGFTNGEISEVTGANERRVSSYRRVVYKRYKEEKSFREKMDEIMNLLKMS